MPKLSLLYPFLGACVGLCLVAVAYSFSLDSQGLPFSIAGIKDLHLLFPLYYLLDTMPMLFAIPLYLIGKQADRHIKDGNRLKRIIAQKTEALKESNKKLNAIFNSSSDINVLIGLDRKIIAFNRAASSFMVDISGKEFLGIGDDIFYHVSEIAKGGFTISFNIAASGNTIKFVENFRLFKSTLDKKLVWLFIELHPVMGDDGNIEGVSMNITDITKRKEIEAAMRQQNRQLKKIAWIQSHQIRKPVANILGLIPLIDDNSLNGEQKELFGYLKTATTELDNYIKEIIAEAKPTNNQD